MSISHLQMTTALAGYCIDMTVDEHPVLTSIREKTANIDAPMMMIDPLQGKFFQFLVKLIQAKKTLDIGVFTGYSSLAVALALPEGGQVTACDCHEAWTNIAKASWQEAGVAEKIHFYLAPAADTLARLIDRGEEGSYDFAFIDADKASYDQYYEQCLVLCRPGAIIALDNMLDGGRVADPEIQTDRVNRFRQLTQKINQDNRVTHAMLPINDGVLLVIKH